MIADAGEKWRAPERCNLVFNEIGPAAAMIGCAG